MSKFKRFLSILAGIILIILAIVMQLEPEIGYAFLIIFIGLGLTYAGLKELIYYFFMARHMVDGKLVLYSGVIELNLGVFTVTMATIPMQYAMVYLMMSHLFTATVTILRALEAKRLGAGLWKRKFGYGILQLVIALVGIVNISSVKMVVVIYGIGLVVSGCERIRRAFQRTTIVYVQ